MQLPTDTNTPPMTPQSTTSMRCPPLQPNHLEASLQTHGNDTPSSPSPPNTSANSSLSPADLRTLSKILSEHRSPLTPPSPGLSDVDEGLRPETVRDEERSESSDDDGLGYGDEREKGYEDEDGSMELSDSEQYVRDVEVEDAYEGDGDTIEDIMNLPGNSAAPAVKQNFSRFYGEDEGKDGEDQERELFRAGIEKKLEVERLEQEGHRRATAEEDVYDEGMGFDGVQGTSLEVCGDSNVRASEDETEVRVVNGDGKMGDAETSNDYDIGWSASLAPKSIPRRASDGTPISLSSFISATNYPIDLSPNTTNPESPFFKQSRSKENSPSKRHRNAASPEEIAELAREAGIKSEIDDDDQEDLDQYREMDLAPMEPVMDSDSAGDLITSGTPVKPQGSQSFASLSLDQFQLRSTSPRESFRSIPEPMQQTKDVLDDKPDNRSEKSAITSSQSPPAESRNPVLGHADTVSDQEQKQLILYPQQPAFITVIGMLPRTIMWATAAAIAMYSSKAYNALVDKFWGLAF
ncbi:Nn.00g053230.m01.CDS01 [Neocucurbitaria sp. VM-36]